MERVDLSKVVPSNAVSVMLAYRIEPPGGRAFLWRTPNDPAPIPLTESEGKLVVKLIEPSTIYYECTTDVPGTRLWLDLSGYENPQGGYSGRQPTQ